MKRSLAALFSVIGQGWRVPLCARRVPLYSKRGPARAGPLCNADALLWGRFGSGAGTRAL